MTSRPRHHKPPIDVEACAKAAWEEHRDYTSRGLLRWENQSGEAQGIWKEVAAAVLKAAGVKT